MGSGQKHKLSISLPAKTIEWLDASVKSQALSSRSKAVRCCINCVAINDVKMVKYINDNTNVPTSTYQTFDIELASEQVNWINSATSSIKGFSSQSKVIQSVAEACMNADEDLVFGVIRCKSKVTTCEGAQEAIDLLSERKGENNIKVKEEIKLL